MRGVGGLGFCEKDLQRAAHLEAAGPTPTGEGGEHEESLFSENLSPSGLDGVEGLDGMIPDLGVRTLVTDRHDGLDDAQRSLALRFALVRHV